MKRGTFLGTPKNNLGTPLFILSNNVYIYILKLKYIAMGKFEIYKDKREEFRFRLKAGNGQNILASEGYSSKSSCENGVESVKNNAPNDSKYERLESKGGSPYFNLKASNGQVIGTSEMYSSSSAMESGIESVKNNAPNASVDDLT